MRVRTLAAVLLLVTAGCFSEEEPESAKRIEPKGIDLKILKVEGIKDPYSQAGQRRLRKLAGDRAKLEKIRADAAARAQPRSREGDRKE